MSMLDLELGPMVRDLGPTTDVNVLRPGPVTGSDGKGTPIAADAALTRACIWHPSSRSLLIREGLDTSKAWYTVYSEEEIQVGDVFTLDDEDWTLFDLLPYSGSGLWTGRALRKE